MIEWFNDLSVTNKIAVVAIVVPVCVAIISGLFILARCLFSKKIDPSVQQKTSQQNGENNTAIIADDNKGNIAGRDIHTGIDSKEALTILVETSTNLGRSEAEKEQLRQKVKNLKSNWIARNY